MNHRIVLARTETYYVPDGPWAADLGHRPKMKPQTDATAMIWLNEGTEDDVAKATAWAARETVDEGNSRWVVFAYPVDEPDPLGRAKAEILREVKP